MSMRFKGRGGGGVKDLNKSDLLLESPLSGRGGGSGRRRLDGFIGHDACGELLLGLLEAGARGAVQGVDLRGGSHKRR